MQAWIFFYDMKQMKPKTRTKALEELFGRTKQSHGGKYQHTLKGKLLQGDFIRPVRAALIVQDRHKKTVSKFLRECNIPYRSCRIRIKSTDFRKSEFLCD